MGKYYTVDVERSVDALAHCLKQLTKIHDIDDWYLEVNAGGINYGIYLNFNIKDKEITICNQPERCADDSMYLEDIIDMINRKEDEDGSSEY